MVRVEPFCCCIYPPPHPTTPPLLGDNRARPYLLPLATLEEMLDDSIRVDRVRGHVATDEVVCVGYSLLSKMHGTFYHGKYDESYCEYICASLVSISWMFDQLHIALLGMVGNYILSMKHLGSHEHHRTIVSHKCGMKGAP